MFGSSSWISIIGSEMILAEALMFDRNLAVAPFPKRCDPQQASPSGLMTPTIGSKTTSADPAPLPVYSVIIEVELCANAEKW